MDHPELNLATRHPDDPERLIVVRLGRIADERQPAAAWDFLQSWQLLPTYLERPGDQGQGMIRTYPIEAPSLETACLWLEMITANCVMFNP
jgi:hypothetical protein